MYKLRRRPPEDKQGNARNMSRCLINVLYVNKQEFCASSWRSNQGYTMMHGQPIIKIFHVRSLFNTHFFFLPLVFHEDVLLRVREQRNILHEIRKRKANGIGHILRRNCLLQRVTEGKIQGGIEVTGRQGIRRRKLLDDLKERRGYSHLKEEALDRTMWRARFGRGFGPVVRQTTK